MFPEYFQSARRVRDLRVGPVAALAYELCALLDDVRRESFVSQFFHALMSYCIARRCGEGEVAAQTPPAEGCAARAFDFTL
jgi:hypothetical protein